VTGSYDEHQVEPYTRLVTCVGCGHAAFMRQPHIACVACREKANQGWYCAYERAPRDAQGNLTNGP
jgi:hypothetical protein